MTAVIVLDFLEDVSSVAVFNNSIEAHSFKKQIDSLVGRSGDPPLYTCKLFPVETADEVRAFIISELSDSSPKDDDPKKGD